MQCRTKLPVPVWALGSVVALLWLFDAGPVAAQSTGESDLLGLQLLGLAVVFWILYIVPTIIAFRRKHPNRWLILVVNVVFGATGLGWLGSLVWACSALHVSPAGSNGGESGLNLFVNDPARPAHDGHPANAMAPAPIASALPDPIEQLTQLQALRQTGVLEDAEFDALKRKLMEQLN